MPGVNKTQQSFHIVQRSGAEKVTRKIFTGVTFLWVARLSGWKSPADVAGQTERDEEDEKTDRDIFTCHHVADY